MIFNSTPQDEAVVSNVGNIGEFRIRNSAKAFGILSSGLYANKIRAVIRELSCNAVDSHVAAGKRDVPFDVHLPNQLEPWFAVRDYGLGLNQAQVTNIYTTYFESTKTASNELIGGLGLGSKSPFAYTDNFTVTATRDGVKGIYTAFINESGVPSIALMTETATDEPNGVEVKFSVNDRADFQRFSTEAEYVFMTFDLQPVVQGVADFAVAERKYHDRDIVPGVHSLSQFGNRHFSGSYAIMGNVPYPIEMPNAEQNLGEVRHLLSCSLEINFAIGEIDFQASREGLSYVPQTIAAIKAKLEAVNAVLATRLADEVNALPDSWKQRDLLHKKVQQGLWQAAVYKYLDDTKFPLIDRVASSGRYLRNTKFKLLVEDLAAKFNIKLAGFNISSYYNTASSVKTEIDRQGSVPGSNPIEFWTIVPTDDVYYVINDVKIGVTERAKYHWRNRRGRASSETVYVLNPADKNLPVDAAGFFKLLYNPLPEQQLLASTLDQKARAGTVGATGPVSIMMLAAPASGGSRYRNRGYERVWRKVDDLAVLDPVPPAGQKAQTFYYIGLTGFEAISRFGFTDAKDLELLMKHAGVPALKVNLYGVRKADIDAVKARPNWINVEDFITKTLTQLDDNFWRSVIFEELKSDFSFLTYPGGLFGKQVSPSGLFYKTYQNYMGLTPTRIDAYYLDQLLAKFTPGKANPLDNFRARALKECRAVHEAYPMLAYTGEVKPSNKEKAQKITEYIQMIDAKRRQDANLVLAQVDIA